jgi:hypothetical protein
MASFLVTLKPDTQLRGASLVGQGFLNAVTAYDV